MQYGRNKINDVKTKNGRLCLYLANVIQPLLFYTLLILYIIHFCLPRPSEVRYETSLRSLGPVFRLAFKINKQKKTLMIDKSGSTIFVYLTYISTGREIQWTQMSLEEIAVLVIKYNKSKNDIFVIYKECIVFVKLVARIDAIWRQIILKKWLFSQFCMLIPTKLTSYILLTKTCGQQSKRRIA